MHYIELLKVFVQVLPLIIDLVKKLDDLPSSEGTGADKLQIVLDAVNYSAAGHLSAPNDSKDRFDSGLDHWFEPIRKILAISKHSIFVRFFEFLVPS